MTGRALLNVTHALLLEGAGPEERADLRAQLTDPVGWAAEQRQRTLDDLAVAGGEVA